MGHNPCCSQSTSDFFLFKSVVLTCLNFDLNFKFLPDFLRRTLEGFRHHSQQGQENCLLHKLAREVFMSAPLSNKIFWGYGSPCSASRTGVLYTKFQLGLQKETRVLQPMVKTSHCETLLVCTHTYSRGDSHNQFSVMSLLSLCPSFDKPFG